MPPRLTLARCGQSLAHALAVAVLATPLVIATRALFPALLICPFFTAAYRHQVTRLLARAREGNGA